MSSCQNPLVCAVRGPIMLIALGTLFAVGQHTPYRFSRTWPVLLILLGVLKLLERAVGGRQDSGTNPPAGVVS
ncbi:MAG: LiaI-LiaF-like domain-containing protein [Bryobacteraceae bacterium]